MSESERVVNADGSIDDRGLIVVGAITWTDVSKVRRNDGAEVIFAF